MGIVAAFITVVGSTTFFGVTTFALCLILEHDVGARKDCLAFLKVVEKCWDWRRLVFLDLRTTTESTRR